MEEVRSYLQRETTEHQVKFTKFHEKRAEIVAELYNQLVQIEEDIQELDVTNIEEKDFKEKLFTIIENHIALQQYLRRNKIYLYDDEYHPLFKLSKKIYQLSRMEYASKFGKTMPPIANEESVEQSLRNVISEIREEILELQITVEEKFRSILSVVDL